MAKIIVAPFLGLTLYFNKDNVFEIFNDSSTMVHHKYLIM